jgi:hypothetical protein
MSQPNVAAPLADEPEPILRTLLLGFLVVPTALLLGSVFDPDALSAERLAFVLGVQAAGTAIFAALEDWDLRRAMRRAEPAGAVIPTSAKQKTRLGATATVSFMLIVGAALVFGDAYTLVASGAALLLGEELGPLVAKRVAHRRQRRLGRRYYRTIDEPEQVVWLGASGLE